MPSGERRCCGQADAAIFAAALKGVGIAGVAELVALATIAALSGANAVATAGHARAIFGKAVGAADSAIGVTVWVRRGRSKEERQELRLRGAKSEALASRRAWLPRDIALALVALGATAPDSVTLDLWREPAALTCKWARVCDGNPTPCPILRILNPAKCGG